MTAESKAEHTNRLYRRLAVAQRQCDDATELLNAERLRSADLRAALRRIVAVDGWSEGDPAEAIRVATRVAADALEDGQPRG